MSTKEKQGLTLYFLIAFGLAWLCQVGGCMALLQQKNAVLYQLALIATMFCPLLAVLLVQKVFLRQPVGIGWKVQGKRRFWLAAWFGPAVFTLLGAVLYFAVFPSRLDFSCSWLVAAYGGEMDAQTAYFSKRCWGTFVCIAVRQVSYLQALLLRREKALYTQQSFPDPAAPKPASSLLSVQPFDTRHLLRILAQPLQMLCTSVISLLRFLSDSVPLWQEAGSTFCSGRYSSCHASNAQRDAPNHGMRHSHK